MCVCIVSVFQAKRYNTSVAVNYCRGRLAATGGCSHLCLLVPNGATCACPDNTKSQDGSGISCDATHEPALPLPLSCPCKNGGVCTDGDENGRPICACPISYNGPVCENLDRQRVPLWGSSVSPEAVAIPIVIIFILVFAIGLYLVLKRGNL